MEKLYIKGIIKQIIVLVRRMYFNYSRKKNGVIIIFKDFQPLFSSLAL